MIDCLSPGELQAYADGEMAAPEAVRVRQHVEGCPDCQLMLAEVEESNCLIGSLLSLEIIPAAPPFSVPAAASRARLTWLWISGIILAALVAFLAWQQIGEIFLLHSNLWLAAGSMMEDTLSWLISQLPLLMVKLASSSLWTDEVRVQGIFQGLVILAIIGFIRWFNPKIPVRRNYV